MGKKINEGAKTVGSCSLTPPSNSACDKALTACDKVVRGLSTENKKQTELLGLQDEKASLQSKEIQRLRDRQDSFINSKILWFGLGVVAGGAALLYVTK